MTNSNLLDFSKRNGHGQLIATNTSIANYIGIELNTEIELYHKSESGSEYYLLKDVLKEDGSYFQLRISDHDILSRTNIAAMGSANEEFVGVICENDKFDLDDLNEWIADFKGLWL